MSLREVREEFKEAEGDPKIKGRIRQLRMERSRRRMMAAVPVFSWPRSARTGTTVGKKLLLRLSRI